MDGGQFILLYDRGKNSDIFILWFGFRLRNFVHSSFSYTHNIVSSNSIAAPALVALVQLYTRCTIKILLSASSLAERGSHNNMLSLISLVNLKKIEKVAGFVIEHDKH